jgi:hypothetical protein
MEADGPRRLSVDRRTALRVAVAAAVIAALVFGLSSLLGGDDGGEEAATVKGPPGEDFTLVRPDGWSEVSDDEREGLPGNPLLVMRRGEGQGLLIVNAPSGSERDLEKVSRSLDERLQNAIPDFRKASARVVEVKAGPALLYSYARAQKATAHTILVVPTDDRTYTLNGVVPAGADDAAREVGRILFSFDV